MCRSRAGVMASQGSSPRYTMARDSASTFTDEESIAGVSLRGIKLKESKRLIFVTESSSETIAAPSLLLFVYILLFHVHLFPY